MKRVVFVALLLFARDGIQRVIAPPAPVGWPAGKKRVRASQDLHPRPTRDARSWKRNGMIADGSGGRGTKRGGWKTQACSSTHAKEGWASSSSQRGLSAGLTVEPSQHESLRPWRNFVAGWDIVLMERHHLPSRIDTTEETPLLKVPTVVCCCGATVCIGMFCCSLLAQSGSDYGTE